MACPEDPAVAWRSIDSQSKHNHTVRTRRPPRGPMSTTSPDESYFSEQACKAGTEPLPSPHAVSPGVARTPSSADADTSKWSYLPPKGFDIGDVQLPMLISECSEPTVFSTNSALPSPEHGPARTPSHPSSAGNSRTASWAPSWSSQPSTPTSPKPSTPTSRWFQPRQNAQPTRTLDRRDPRTEASASPPSTPEMSWGGHTPKSTTATSRRWNLQVALPTPSRHDPTPSPLNGSRPLRPPPSPVSMTASPLFDSPDDSPVSRALSAGASPPGRTLTKSALMRPSRTAWELGESNSPVSVRSGKSGRSEKHIAFEPETSRGVPRQPSSTLRPQMPVGGRPGRSLWAANTSPQSMDIQYSLYALWAVLAFVALRLSIAELF